MRPYLLSVALSLWQRVLWKIHDRIKDQRGVTFVRTDSSEHVVAIVGASRSFVSPVTGRYTTKYPVVNLRTGEISYCPVDALWDECVFTRIV